MKIFMFLLVTFLTLFIFEGYSCDKKPETHGGPKIENSIAQQSNIASMHSLARVRVDGSIADSFKSHLLEILLKPIVIARDEEYLVIVSVDDPDNSQLTTISPGDSDTVSFFPSPQLGETRRFLIDIPSLKSGLATTLQIRLIPSGDISTPFTSAVEVVGARWVN